MSDRDDLPDEPRTPPWDDEQALTQQLGRALGHDPDATPPAERVAALRAAAEARRTMAPAPPAPPAATPIRPPSRRRALLTGSLAAGVAGVLGYAAGESRQPEPTRAVPVEQISFSGDAEVTTSALINHTWGTELLLDVSGLHAGLAYDVVYDTEAGDVAAGSLLAVAGVVMRCRFNAAPVRRFVHAIEVRSPAGDAVLRADLPDAPA